MNESLFGHLLEYQATPEGQQETRQAIEQYRCQLRAYSRKGTKAYRLRHPDWVLRRKRLKKHRMTLYCRGGGICRYCQQCLDPQRFHIDHIIPISKGGTDVLDNLCVACPECNARKGSQMIGPFALPNYAKRRRVHARFQFRSQVLSEGTP